MLLSLKKSICDHLNATIPARVQSYLSAGKPIVGMSGHGVQALISEYNCGFMASAGDYKQLYINILRLYNDRQLLKDMGINARKVYKHKYTIDICMNALEDIITT